ncbi:MAG: hypothetical protein WCW31_03225 [Patescibacteria group bacterium]
MCWTSRMVCEEGSDLAVYDDAALVEPPHFQLWLDAGADMRYLLAFANLNNNLEQLDQEALGQEIQNEHRRLTQEAFKLLLKPENTAVMSKLDYTAFLRTPDGSSRFAGFGETFTMPGGACSPK